MIKKQTIRKGLPLDEWRIIIKEEIISLSEGWK
jgi:hypothetical protein